uniref:Uncharacterized protein n=1 Tax=Tetranychus urticae TaxID=32264 RepID=T1L1Z8_TETUR
MIFDTRFEPFDDLEPESPTSIHGRQIPVRRVKSARNYTHRRRERCSLRVPKTTYTTRDYTYPRSLESIDDWSLYRHNGPPSPLPGASAIGLNATNCSTPTTTCNSMVGEPRGARRVQSFRCTSKGSVVKMGDFFLGNASPDNYVAKEETNHHHHYHHPSMPHHPSEQHHHQPGSSTVVPVASSSSYVPRGSPTCSRKSSNSCDSLRSSKTFHVYVAGFKSVGKHRVMNACLGNSVNEKLKATILIDYEQFNINFKIIDKIEDSDELDEDSLPSTVQATKLDVRFFASQTLFNLIP